MIIMHFCRECNNLLYPKEDKINKCLVYACRNCDYTQKAKHNCVYRQEVKHYAREQTQIIQDVSMDPTLPRTKSVRCCKCNHGEAVYFQGTAASKAEEGMILSFVCCNVMCGHRWRDSN